MILTETSPGSQTFVPQPRRARRSRRFPPRHWRARLAAWLDRISQWLNPLGAP